MMTNKGYYQNCKFHYPLGRSSCAGALPYKSHSENTSSSLLLTYIRQTECIVMVINKETDLSVGIVVLW